MSPIRKKPKMKSIHLDKKVGEQPLPTEEDDKENDKIVFKMEIKVGKIVDHISIRKNESV